jgi:hypothetical protein
MSSLEQRLVIDSATAAERRETERIRRRRDAWWRGLCGCLIAAILLYLAMDAVFDRTFNLNIGDGVSYLDIATRIAKGDPTAFQNAYWSPGYPVALFAGLSILRPSPAMELAAVYWINWAIGLLALACLIYFITGVPLTAKGSGRLGLTRPMLAALGLALFLIAAQADAPVYQLTPDLLLAAWLWLAGGAFLRIAHRQRLRDYALLGIALALAYFTKVVALSMTAGALAILPFTGTRRTRALLGTALTMVLVALPIAPYVAGLSKYKGRFTFGDSGSLNYAWVVDNSSRLEVANDSYPGHARLNLIHPARRLLKWPETWEFGSSPIRGSFPIWNDPSYWDEGTKPVFYLKGELWHIAMNTYHTINWLGRRAEIVIALLLAFLAQRRARVPARLRGILPVLLWFAALWALYMAVDVEDRYVFSALTAVLILGAAMVRMPDTAAMRKLVAAGLLIVVCGAAARGLGAVGMKAFRGVKATYIGPEKTKAVGPYDNPYWQVAQSLTGRVGLRAHDSVACLELGCDSPFWARLAGVRVTADIPRPGYWEAAPADRAKAMAALSAAGVKAIVARHLGPGAEAEHWIPLGADYYARLTKSD